MLQPLVGRTIKSVGYLTPAEIEEQGWDRSCVVITLDDGTMLYPSADDEGNDAGALVIVSHNPKLPSGAPVI